jgi:hypothetical protein
VSLETDIMSQQLLDHPEDKTLALILADALQEEHNDTRLAALQCVGRLRRMTKNSRELNDAAELCDIRAEWYVEIMDAIADEIDVEAIGEFHLFIVTGSRPPTSKRVEQSNPSSTWHEWHITVGARWILERAAWIRWEVTDRAQRDKFTFLE